MENTENNPTSADALLEEARNIAASLAVATQSELVSGFVGSAVMDNDFIHLDIDGNNPFLLPLLDATTTRWAESGLADTFIIDSRYCETLELGDLTGNPTRAIAWTTSVVDGHTIVVGRFSHTIEEYSLELEKGEYLELPDLRTSLRRYINENPVIEDDERDPTGWETLIAFLHQVNFQLKTLDDMCYDGKVSYPELEDWEREDYDPLADCHLSPSYAADEEEGENPGGGGQASTLPDGSSAVPDRGALADKAANILMQVLYAARYAKFDVLCAVARLAQKISKWTTECDVALHRLMCYIHSTLKHRLVGHVGNRLEDVRVNVYADADFAGDPSTKRSTTGVHPFLRGEFTYLPGNGPAKHGILTTT